MIAINERSKMALLLIGFQILHLSAWYSGHNFHRNL